MNALERGGAMTAQLRALDRPAALLLAAAFAERLVAMGRASTVASLEQDAVDAALERVWDDLAGRADQPPVNGLVDRLLDALPVDTSGAVLHRRGAALEFYVVQGLADLLGTLAGGPEAQKVAVQLCRWLNSHLVNQHAIAMQDHPNLTPYWSDASANTGFVAEAAVEDEELLDVAAPPVDIVRFRARARRTGDAIAAQLVEWESAIGARPTDE